MFQDKAFFSFLVQLPTIPCERPQLTAGITDCETLNGVDAALNKALLRQVDKVRITR
jgi:hypothetical protein